MIQSRTFERQLWVAAIILLIGLNGVMLKKWVVTDTRPLAWDQSIHTRVTFDYRDRFVTEGWSSVLKPAYFNYPPLYHITVIPALAFVDDVADAGAAANFFYLALLIVMVFLIGRDLMGPAAGFTAAFLISAYPIVFDMATQTMVDLALTAWVSCAMWFLIRSENFSQMAWSIAFGVALGLGMLTKWTALAYVLGPLIVAAVIAAKMKRIRWLVLSLGLAGVIMAPWYLTNLTVMLSRISHVSSLTPASGYVLSGMASFLWYPLSLFEEMNLLFVLLFIPGLLAFVWRPTLRPLLLWFFVSMILFTIIKNRNTRYLLPALPAVALLTPAWLPPIRKIPFYLMNAIVAFYFFTFHLEPEKTIVFNIGGLSIPVVGWHAPLSQDWKHEDVIQKIQELKSPEKLARVLVVSNYGSLHSTTLNVSLRARGIHDIDFRGTPKRRWFEFADFILVKSGDLGPESSIKYHKECADVIESQPEWFTQTFHEVASWPAPDDSNITLYQLAPQPHPVGDTGILNLSLERMDLPNVTAEGVEIEATPISKADTAVGRLKELRVSCKKVSYKSVAFENVVIDLIRPQINLPLFLESQDLQMLSLKTLRPTASIPADSLLSMLKAKAKWLKDPMISFEKERIVVSGRAGFLPLYVSVNLHPEEQTLYIRTEKLTMGGVPLPRFLIGAMLDRKVSLSANDEMPYNLEIKSIQGENGRLKIN